MPNDTERWLPVPGYEGLYEVSDLGRLKTWHNHKGPNQPVPRLMKQTLDHSGYLSVSLWRDGERRSRKVHALVLEAFVGPRPDQMVTRHLNANRTDNQLVNLAWGTVAENAQDRVAHGHHSQALKTHCVNGHPLSGDNVYVPPKRPTNRMCRECMREASRRQAAAIRRSG